MGTMSERYALASNQFLLPEPVFPMSDRFALQIMTF